MMRFPKSAGLTAHLRSCSKTKSAYFSLFQVHSPQFVRHISYPYSTLYSEFRSLGIDEIYCISVNDPFVMDAWREASGAKDVKLIPDGSAEFTRKMGMLVHKDNLGFGMRSWRYAAIINDQEIEAWFEEPGFADNCEDDPYGETTPQNLLDYLRA
jgi:peroxiredoxin